MEYLDKKGLAHLVEKNNETYALKRENNNLKGQVLSLKTKLKKRDKKIVVRKAINPNSVNEGNVWYYHHNPVLYLRHENWDKKTKRNGSAYYDWDIYVNDKPLLSFISPSTPRMFSVNGGGHPKNVYIIKDKTYFGIAGGGDDLVAVYLGLPPRLDTQGYLTRVESVEYTMDGGTKIWKVYLSVKEVNNFSSNTTSPYLAIQNGKIVGTSVIPNHGAICYDGESNIYYFKDNNRKKTRIGQYHSVSRCSRTNKKIKYGKKKKFKYNISKHIGCFKVRYKHRGVYVGSKIYVRYRKTVNHRYIIEER